MSNTQAPSQVQAIRMDDIPRPRKLAAKIFSYVTDVSIYVAVVLVPLFFITSTPEALEINKQTLLIVLALFSLTAWLGLGMVEKRFSLSRSWLHVAVLAFGLGYLAVAACSQDRYLSLVGGTGQATWSFATIFAGIILYFVLVNRVKTLSQIYNLVLAFFVSSFIAALYGLLQQNGWFIFPWSVTRQAAFTTVGSAYSLAAFMVVPLVMASALALHGCRDSMCILGARNHWGLASRITVWLSGISALAVILIVDLKSIWALLLIGVAFLLVISYLRAKKIGRPRALIVPGALIVIAAVFLFVKVPFKAHLPSEITPSLGASWGIVQKTLAAHPLIGSGPGSWIYDYTLHRVPMVNLSPFWNVRFDRGYSTLITLLGTLGILGFGLWLMLLVAAVAVSWSHLVRERRDDAWYAYLTLFSGFAAVVLVSFVYNYNLAHLFVFWFLLALLGGLSAQQGWTWEGRAYPALGNVFSAIFTLTAVLGIITIWLTGQRWTAEWEMAKAVEINRQNGTADQMLERLEAARSLNPNVDTYTRSLSQVHLMKAVAAIKNHPSSEQLPALKSEITLAVDLARETVNRWPANVDNWSNLAAVYQTISGSVDSADTFAINNYLEAIKREPQNPVFYSEIGKILFQRSEQARQQADALDEKTKQAAKKQADLDLDSAAQYLHNAVSLKSDYLPARYYLAAVYERQGHLKDAIGELEKVLTQNNRDSGLAFELAILYYRNLEKNRALALMEKVVQVDPSNVNAQWYLASMYDEAGRLADAINQLKALANSVPNNAAITQRLAELQNRAAPAPQPLPEPLKVDEPAAKTGLTH